MDREYVMVRGVIFDMDGLMFDTEPVWGENLKPATDALGLAYKPGLSDAVRGTAGGEFAKVVHAWYDESVNADELWDVWHAIVEEHLRAGVEKKPGLDELLAYLGEQGIPAAVASSSPASQIALRARAFLRAFLPRCLGLRSSTPSRSPTCSFARQNS